MNKYNVYGISEWPESLGEKFLIYCEKEFPDEESAAIAAKASYGNNVEIVVEII